MFALIFAITLAFASTPTAADLRELVGGPVMVRTSDGDTLSGYLIQFDSETATVIGLEEGDPDYIVRLDEIDRIVENQVQRLIEKSQKKAKKRAIDREDMAAMQAGALVLMSMSAAASVGGALLFRYEPDLHLAIPIMLEVTAVAGFIGGVTFLVRIGETRQSASAYSLTIAPFRLGLSLSGRF